MGKNKRLPNDAVLAALQLVRGQDRRRAAYKEKVREIISHTGAGFVDTQNRAGQPVRVYMPRAKGGTSNTTADKAEAIDQLEQQRDVQIMRAIDAATEEIGADIQDEDTRKALKKAIALNCTDCRVWVYERLDVPGISRRDFYRRRRRYLEDVAVRVGLA